MNKLNSNQAISDAAQKVTDLCFAIQWSIKRIEKLRTLKYEDIELCFRPCTKSGDNVRLEVPGSHDAFAIIAGVAITHEEELKNQMIIERNQLLVQLAEIGGVQ